MARDTRDNQDARMDARAGEGVRGRAERPRRRRATEFEHSSMGERLIAGVPARLMAPRLVFIVCLAALLAFGLLMVYSASAVEALQEAGSSTYFLGRQSLFIVLGVIIVLVMCKAPFLSLELYRNRWSRLFWVLIVGALGLIFVIGAASGGAARWLDLGGFNFQPSEFAKPVMVIFAAQLAQDYYWNRSLDRGTLLFNLALAVGFPVLLVFLQPDMGSSIIILGTVFVMFILAGMPLRFSLGLFGAALLVGFAAIIAKPYRLARLMVIFDPWKDAYGDGYQATLAIMAFASGGLFGRGIGGSTMKYNYLPEAHNDYILAIIGEELGLVGTALFFAVFIALVVSGFMIGSRCKDKFGQLIAQGCSSMLAIQFFVNVMGILSITPMTGKPIPFISYGGSAIVSAMILAGLILRVSIESAKPTVYSERRSSLSVVDRGRSGQPGSGFSVMDGGSVRGGSSRQAPSSRGRRPSPRGSSGYGGAGISGGYDRVNLNGDPSDRLRSRGSGPRVNGYDGSRRRDGYGGRGGTSQSTRRGRYDR